MRSRLGRRSLLVTGLAAACAAQPAPPPEPIEASIAVAERGWHTDLGLAVGDIAPPLAGLTTVFPGTRTLMFGFGERQYLLSRHVGPLETLSALLPSQGAILMTALAGSAAAAFDEENVVMLGVSHAGLARLTAFIWDTLETQDDGTPVRLADGPYPGSVFYAARTTYDGLMTCNTWTASGLRAAGLPVNDAVIFSGQVMRQARRIAARQRLPPS